MTLLSFLDQLEDYLSVTYSWVSSLVTQGYFVEKTKLIALTRAHVEQIELCRIGGVEALVHQHTWNDPHLGEKSVVAATPAAAARPAAARPPATSAGTLSSTASSAPIESAGPA